MSRYARQLQVSGFGPGAQQKIEAAEVQILGEGLVAKLCALYLVGAGVGRVMAAESILLSCRDYNVNVRLSAEPNASAQSAENRIRIDASAHFVEPGFAVKQGAKLALLALQKIVGAER